MKKIAFNSVITVLLLTGIYSCSESLEDKLKGTSWELVEIDSVPYSEENGKTIIKFKNMFGQYVESTGEGRMNSKEGEWTTTETAGQVEISILNDDGTKEQYLYSSIRIEGDMLYLKKSGLHNLSFKKLD